MNLIKNESGQAAGIIMFVVAIFAIGFFYILLSGMLQPYLDQFNLFQSNPSMHTSQNNRDMMDTLFRYWWAVPIVTLVVAAIYGIKNALSDQTGEAY